MMPTGGIEVVQNGKSDALMKVARRGCSVSWGKTLVATVYFHTRNMGATLG